MIETFHKGEIAVQQKVGEQIMASSVGRIISDKIPKRVNRFIEEQPMIIVSSTDKFDHIWTSVLFGNIGFTSVLKENTISIEKSNIYSTITDVFFDNIKEQKEIGTLFIELSTRRRFRINGTLQLTDSVIEVSVQEAYPNCPKYIQQRVVNVPKDYKQPKAVIENGTTINQQIKDWIIQSDTFFIGSKSNNNKLDASHRGGNKGFIEIIDNTLKIPDYKGNSMYNTLGNIHQNSKAGLLFIDFEKGKILQLTGKSNLLFEQNSEEDLIKTGGTGRYLLFNIKKWIKTENHHNIKWDFLSNSPFNSSF
ncbi:MAG: pyridoxamine 5'-phosphate oxidase [Chlorobi bacterium]|nr:pyridoxamine 5'-phosphate oxidase [Chlorobiota bacterium]